MRNTHVRFGIAATAALALIAVPSCSSTDEPPPKNQAPTSASQSAAAPTDDPRPQLKTALLTASEVGPGFEEAPWEEPDLNEPGPCGKPGPGATYPDALRVGAEFSHPDQLELVEGLTVYPDTETAKAAYGIGVDGLACGQGTLGPGGPPVEIGEPTDVTQDVGGQEATSWSVKTSDLDGIVIAVHLDQAVMTFSFLAAQGADTSNAPEPLDVAKAGVTKAQNA